MSFPGDGRPSESLSVTVMSVAVIPSAVTGVGNATSPAEAAGGGTNDSVAFCVKVLSSVVSSAVKLRFSVLRSVIEKTAAPSLSVTALGGVIVALPEHRGKRYRFPADWKSVGVREDRLRHGGGDAVGWGRTVRVGPSRGCKRETRVGRARGETGKRLTQLQKIGG